MESDNNTIQSEIPHPTGAEQELRLLLRIAQDIAASGDFLSSVDVALRRISESTGWEFGEAWIPSSDGTALEYQIASYEKSIALAQLRELSRLVRFSPGVGLPGRVWLSKSAEWVRDISSMSSPRAQILGEIGLKAALGVPIVVDDKVLCVLVFYMRVAREEDLHLVEIVSAVAAQLVSVIQQKPEVTRDMPERKNAEDTLRESEAYIKTIMDKCPSMVFLKDPQGRYVYSNPQFEKITHKPSVEIIGNTDYEIFSYEQAAAFCASDLKVLEAGIPLEFEEVALHDDGPHTSVVSKFLLSDAEGKFYAVCGIATDITERKRAEEALRQVRSELEIHVQNLAAELVQANRALQAEIAYRRRIQQESNARANQQAAVSQIGQLELSGVDLSALMEEACSLVARTLGVEFCKILELLPDSQTLRLRAGVGWKEGLVGRTTVSSGFQSQAGYTLLSNAPVVVEDLRAETRFSGPPLLQDHGIVSGMSVIIPGRNRPFGVLSAHTRKRRAFDADDVHFLEAIANVLSEAIERKTAEEEIRRSTNWLERLIETTQDAVVSINRQARIVLFNPGAERIFGYARNEIVGQKVNLLMAEPYATEHDGYIEHYERTGEAWAIGRIRTVTAKRKNGELFPIELSVTKIAEDQNVQYAAFIRDISEKARLQAEAVENERLVDIGTTAAKIGHELANPINGMSLTIQLLEQRFSQLSIPLDTQIISTVNRLHKEVSRLSTLLEQFRSLSRREKFDFQRTTLTALVGDAIEIEMPRYAELGIQVEFSFPSNLPTITVDIDAMKRVILNLTKNAAEAMPGGGRISIQGLASDNSIVLEISDTGTGIPPGIDIFEPFFTTKPQGTGLGLSIVQQIVRAHGGSISYSSEHGKGTTFVIALPQK